MTEKITAIVLDITHHTDKLDVVNLYTRSKGRIGFLSPSGSGKAARLRQARLQPLAVIDADIKFKPSSELQRLGSFSLHEVWTDIYFHPGKRNLALFISEFLNKLLRASMPDENLWDYIYNALQYLDRAQTNINDFHIAFLASLLPFAGIQPDRSGYAQGKVFDMNNGVFKSQGLFTHAQNLLSPEESRIAALLCRINFYNVKALKLNSTLRFSMLRKLLDYYSIHFPGSGKLKSLDILHELYS